MKTEFAEGLNLADPKAENFRARGTLLSGEITGKRKHIEDESSEF